MYLQKLKIAIILYVIILSIVRAQSNIRKARTSEEIRKAASEETTEKNSEETTDKNSEEIREEASEEIRKATRCLTTDNKKCIFPWTYSLDGSKHQGCANPGKDPGGLWCPTGVDDDGVYISGSEKWGYCSDDCCTKPGCLTTDNKKCILHKTWTYSIDGSKHQGCANPAVPDRDSGGLWCPTEVDDDGVYISGSEKWGYCSDDCCTKPGARDRNTEENDSTETETDSTKNIDVPGFERTSLNIEFGHNCGGYWIFMQICNLKNEIDDENPDFLDSDEKCCEEEISNDGRFWAGDIINTKLRKDCRTVTANINPDDSKLEIRLSGWDKDYKSGHEKFCPGEIWVQDRNGATFHAKFGGSHKSVTPFVKLEYKGKCKEIDSDLSESLEITPECL